jgi:hypothetical protein
LIRGEVKEVTRAALATALGDIAKYETRLVSDAAVYDTSMQGQPGSRPR